MFIPYDKNIHICISMMHGVCMYVYMYICMYMHVSIYDTWCAYRLKSGLGLGYNILPMFNNTRILILILRVALYHILQV